MKGLVTSCFASSAQNDILGRAGPHKAIPFLPAVGLFLLLLASLFILTACTQQPTSTPTPTPARLTPTPGVTAQELTALRAQQQELTRVVAELRARLENQTRFSQASLDALRKRVEVLEKRAGQAGVSV